jgi:conjugative transfer signal peptidase TraF
MIRRAFFVFALLSPLALLVLAVRSGLRVNHTESFPVGFYWAISKAPATGDLMFFQPPKEAVFEVARFRGYLGPSSTDADGAELMLKRIAALAGDVVTIDAAGVTVNGQRIPNTEPLDRDLAGRPLPALRLHDYRLQPGEVLPLSDYSPISFDGRYFGPVHKAQIQSVVVPVWTW